MLVFARRVSCRAMKMKIELFKSKSNRLEGIPYGSAEFASMAQAREVGFVDGKRLGADEIAIVSIGSPLVRERWVRDGAQWKRFEPPKPPVGYGIVRDHFPHRKH